MRETSFCDFIRGIQLEQLSVKDSRDFISNAIVNSLVEIQTPLKYNIEHPNIPGPYTVLYNKRETFLKEKSRTSSSNSIHPCPHPCKPHNKRSCEEYNRDGTS